MQYYVEVSTIMFHHHSVSNISLMSELQVASAIFMLTYFYLCIDVGLKFCNPYDRLIRELCSVGSLQNLFARAGARTLDR